MHTSVPPVEIPDDAEAISVGRPDREMHPGRGPDTDAVRAEALERPVVRAFPEQMQVEVRQHPSVTVRIVNLEHVSPRVENPEAVVRNVLAWQADLEDAARFPPRHGV